MVEGQRISDVMNRNVVVVGPDELVDHAVNRISRGSVAIVIHSAEGTLGLLGEDSLRRARGRARIVAELRDEMLPVETAEPDAAVKDVVQGMQARGTISWSLVTEEGRIVGVVSPRDLEAALDTFGQPKYPHTVTLTCPNGHIVDETDIVNWGADGRTPHCPICNAQITL